ncbi:MFS transporter [Lactiplantibacillus plantarum]|uniref:MFS transporter n=1 Tax=Lactiplantibacillus plantarum TaxID=1590 RepID=UPI00093253BA|nr:MFS transporter [Lactiplantibacillus plantarum]MDV9115142.1 MFS transporter [Lactiplantibacillus plantarum]
MSNKESSPVGIVLTMAIGIFLCILDTTVMNIALPAIQTGLSTDLAHLSWALNIYTVLFASLTIPLGRIADIFGRARLYIIGLIVFVLGSLASGLAVNDMTLIIGRGVQSIGAAIVFPASMTIGIKSVSMNKRNTAIAMLGITQGLAAALGPTIGGVVTQFFSWRGIFLINVPFILLSLILCIKLLDLNESHHKTEKIDFSGSLFSMITLFSLTLLLVKGSDWGWTSAKILGLITICIGALIIFILVESRVAQPMIPLALFKDKQFVGSAIATVSSGMFLAALLVLMPSFFTKVQNKTELIAALMITPASFMIFVWSPISGVLLSKLGPKIVTVTGNVMMILGYVTLSTMNPNIYWQVFIAALLIGAGYGIVIGPITVLAAGDFTGDLLTASQSVIGVFRQIGTSLAVAIFVSALSTNLITAKSNVWHYAKTEVTALDISPKAKRDTLAQVRKQLASEKTPKKKQTVFINEKEKQHLINKNYQLAIKKNKLAIAPKNVKQAVFKQVKEEVTTEVDHSNKVLAVTVANIKNKTKKELTSAFIHPYQFALPFTFLMLLTVFLFKKRKVYLKQILAEEKIEP